MFLFICLSIYIFLLSKIKTLLQQFLQWQHTGVVMDVNLHHKQLFYLVWKLNEGIWKSELNQLLNLKRKLYVGLKSPRAKWYKNIGTKYKDSLTTVYLMLIRKQACCFIRLYEQLVILLIFALSFMLGFS